MPIYNLEGLRESAGNPDVSDEVLVSTYAQATGQNMSEVASYLGMDTGIDGGAFSTGLAAGSDQIQGLGYGALAAGADALGFDGAKDYLNEQVETQNIQAQLSNNPDIAQRVEDIDGVGSAFSFGVNQVAKQVPIMGSIVGAGLVTGGLGAGAAVGALGAGYGIGVGSLYNESVEGGNPDAETSFIKAVPYAAAEALVPLGIGKMLRGAFKGKSSTVAAGADEQVDLMSSLVNDPSKLRRVGKAAGTGTVAETITELGQTELEISMRDDLSDEEKGSRRLNAAVTGGLVGGTFSGGAAALTPKRKPAVDETLDIDPEATNDNAEREAAEAEAEGVPTTTATENEAGELDLAPNTGQDQAAEDVEAAEAAAVAEAQEQREVEKEKVRRELEVQVGGSLNRQQQKEKTGEIENLKYDLEQAKQAPPVLTGKGTKKQQKAAGVSAKKSIIEGIEGQIAALEEQLAANDTANTAGIDLARLNNEDVLPSEYKAEQERQQQEAVEAARVAAEQQKQQQQQQESEPISDPVTGADPVVEGDPVTGADPVAGTGPIDVTGQEQEGSPEEQGQTTDEVVFNETEIASIVEKSEAQAAAEVKRSGKLKSEVTSAEGKAEGRVTKSQSFLAAVARHLRSPTKGGFNRMYKANPEGEGGVIVDEEGTAANSQEIDNIRAAYHNILKLGSIFLNDGKQLPKKEDDDSAAASAEIRSEQMPALVQAVEEFIELVGGEANANAIMAVIKGAKESRGGKDSTSNRSVFSYANTLFGRGKADLTTREGFATKADTIVSSLFAAYKDGRLNENFDIAPQGRVVRPNDKQQSKPTGAQTHKSLKDAYKDGYVPNGNRNLKKANYKGLLGVMNRAADSGTATVTSRMLRKLLDRVIKSQRAAGVAETKVVFDTKKGAKPSYDPNTDTITFPELVSAEVALHEILHAILQGYVYTNFGKNNAAGAAIKVLVKNVEKVINTDITKVNGLTDQQRLEAVEVQNILKDLRDSGQDNDQGMKNAVLELISYGNTLYSFKLMLNNLPAPKTKTANKWRLDVKAVWQGIIGVLRQVLPQVEGVGESSASQVLDATIALLQEAHDNPTQSVPLPGTVLKADVTSESVAAKTDRDMRGFGKGTTYGITKFLFDFVNGMLPEGTPAKYQAKIKETLVDFTKKNPNIEKMVRYMNGQLAFGMKLKQVFETFKTDKHTIVQLAELVSSKLKVLIETDMDSAQAYLDYLDGNKNALDNVTGGKLMAARADNLLESLREKTNALPESMQNFFSGKFTENLIFVESDADIGSSSPGKRKLTTIVGEDRKKDEENLTDEWVYSSEVQDADGSVPEGTPLNTGAEYYRVVKMDENGKPMPDKHQGYVRRDIAEQFGGETVLDADGESFAIYKNGGLWKADDSKGDGTVTFTTNKTVAQALKDAKTLQEKILAADSIGVALLNTANTIGTYYASARFFKGLWETGRVNGEIDLDAEERGEVAIAWSSLEELNSYLQASAERDEVPFTPVPADRVQKTKDLKSVATSSKLRITSSYVQMPDTQAMKDQGIPVEVWGDISGKIVTGPVYAAMKDMASREQLFSSSFGKRYSSVLRQFKLSKTTRNPGTHMTNAISNLSLMMAHGISFGTVRYAAEILYLAARNPDKLTDAQIEFLTKFEAYGSLLGNFSATEVSHNVAERMAKDMTDQNEGDLATKTLTMLGIEGGHIENVLRKAGRKAGRADKMFLDIYAAEDNVFRLAAFLHSAGKSQEINSGGSTDITSDMNLTDAQWDEAGKFGREAFLNYDIDSAALNMARQSVMPFASWTYAVVPVLTKIALTKPWMLANVLASYAMVDAFASMLAGEDDEDRKKMGEMYQERLFGSFGPHTMIRIPFLGSDKDPVYWKMGDYIPLVSTGRGVPGGTFGYDNWPGGLAPSGPFVIAASMALSVDAFTGRKTSDPTDTGMDTTMRNVGMVFDMFMPPALSNRNWEKTMKWFDDTKDFTGEPMDGMFAARAFGFKFYNPTTDKERQIKSSSAKFIKRDYGMAISRAKKAEYRKGTPDYAGLREELADLRKRRRDELDELFGREREDD